MNETLNKQINIASGLVLVAFPIWLLIDDLMPQQPTPAKYLAGLAAVSLLGASAFLIARRLWAYLPRVAVALGALTLFGLNGGTGIMTFRFVTGAIRQSEGAIGSDAAFGAALAKVGSYVFLPGIIPPFMLFVMSALLAKFDARSRLAWICVAVAALLFPAGRIALGAPVVLASDALFILGLGYIGLLTMSGKSDATQAKFTELAADARV